MDSTERDASDEALFAVDGLVSGEWVELAITSYRDEAEEMADAAADGRGFTYAGLVTSARVRVAS